MTNDNSYYPQQTKEIESETGVKSFSCEFHSDLQYKINTDRYKRATSFKKKIKFDADLHF